MSNIIRNAAATGTAVALLAAGYLAHDSIEDALEVHSDPAEHSLLLDGSAQSDEIGATTSSTALQGYGRNLARTVLANFPESMDCSDSCEVGTMNISDPTDGKPKYKYEVFRMSGTNVIDVIATEYTPKVIESTTGATIIDGSNGSGVSVLIDLPHSNESQTQPDMPLTAKNISEMLGDPATWVSSMHVSSGDRFATLSRSGLEWGILGPREVRKVETTDNKFDTLLGQFVTAAGSSLLSVEAVEDTSLVSAAK